jgi:hypothetical protein
MAWDAEADRAVGLLAYDLLTPSARAKVDKVLSGGVLIGEPKCRVAQLADAASLAECLHGARRDFMRGVVYDPLPLCPRADAPPPCSRGQCASEALKRALASLTAEVKSPPQDSADTALALESVAYLVSELHQPLHTADNGDRSGERVHVSVPGSTDKRLTLYSIWDEDLVASAIGDAETGLPYLRALVAHSGGAWGQGDIDAWVRESHDVAAGVVYGRLPAPPACGATPNAPEALDRLYLDAGAQTVRTQLAKAAVRLATLLNAALN